MLLALHPTSILKKYGLLCLLLMATITGFGQVVNSPDGKINLVVTYGDKMDLLVRYGLLLNKKQVIIQEGRVGFKLKDSSAYVGWKVTGSKRSTANTTWQPVYGERKTITDNYNALTITFNNTQHPELKLTIDLRVYNEGMAYRYQLENKQKTTPFMLQAEKSDFVFAANDTAWVTPTAQGVYHAKAINDITEQAERPLTVKISSKLYVALGEAGLVDYARMKFTNGGANTLSSILSGEVVQDTLRSPWRYVLVGQSPGNLLEKNYLVLNLNEPSKIKDTRWIKPGAVIRENSLTTTGSYDVIDFAAKHHIPYILFDAGWYGKETADTSDATHVALDPDRSKGPLDLPAVIAYGKTKNVGVVLYVNRRAAERQLDVILPLYQKWGVKGIKFGFVQVGSQKWTSWLHMAIRKAAQYQLMIDAHDEYRPTGYTRTYPNSITQEGIRGDEESPANEHELITFFTRMIAGPADNTNAYFTKRVDKMGSHASQLAKSVCLYSPGSFCIGTIGPRVKTTS
jgi:alpha-glucosidase